MAKVTIRGKAANIAKMMRVGPSQRTIKKRLKELRVLIDNNPDPAVQRIAYGMECAIRWATERTVGWEAPAITAVDLAGMLRRELGVQPHAASSQPQEKP
jgi:hypothetical protein